MATVRSPPLAQLERDEGLGCRTSAKSSIATTFPTAHPPEEDATTHLKYSHGWHGVGDQQPLLGLSVENSRVEDEGSVAAQEQHPSVVAQATTRPTCAYDGAATAGLQV